MSKTQYCDLPVQHWILYMMRSLTQECHIFLKRGRRSFKVLSVVTSCFSGNYVRLWPSFFPGTPLKYCPVFDGRVVEYPNRRAIRDYLSWRQADTHINNQVQWCDSRVRGPFTFHRPVYIFHQIHKGICSNALNQGMLVGEVHLHPKSIYKLVWDNMHKYSWEFGNCQVFQQFLGAWCISGYCILNWLCHVSQFLRWDFWFHTYDNQFLEGCFHEYEQNHVKMWLFEWHPLG